jgi:sialate O-acetylesterase
MIRFIFKILLFILCFAQLESQAEIKLPALVANHMVLQRNAAIQVWGWANAGETVEISFKGKTFSTSTTSNGNWKCVLGKNEAGGPYKMIVKGKSNTIVIDDILIGDVFVCSGQSNMESSINKALYTKEIEASLNNSIRQFKVNRQASDTLANDVRLHSGWVSASPSTLGAYSAVGYFFANALQQKYHIPVGIINTSYGSSLAEAWISKVGLSDFPDFYNQPKAKTEQSNPMVLYNAMLAPLCNYAVKGVVWYQGEFNASRAYQYRKLLPALINDWRKNFKQELLPFIIIQLPNYNNPVSQPSESAIAELREAQQMASKLPEVAVVTTIDINSTSDLHPIEKKPIGERAAMAAEQLIFKENLVANGPQYLSFRVQRNKIIIAFKQEGGKIKSSNQPLKHFTIAGDDGKFFNAQALLKNNKIEVSSPDVSTPVAVRYAWADNPKDVNLYNTTGLPAAPFRTDNWPGITNHKPSK